MNKTFKSILALALMAVAMTFASCSSDDEVSNVPSQKEIETKIIGKWKALTINGTECLTNNRKVQTFMNNGTGTASISETRSSESGHVWENKEPITYTISNNEFCIKLNSGKRIMYYSVSDISNDKLTWCLYKNVIVNGPVLTPNETCTQEKVTADYSNDIIGLWEGVEMTGYETYGNIEARIEYKADGTYTYYKKVDGEWQPLADVIDEWNVDGDWLATRWQNKGSDVMNYEWWDIDYIKDGMMKWSALREKEDGTRFTTTFTWKKVK